MMSEWHPWFAWRPVRLTATTRYVWFRRIERRLEYLGFKEGARWRYRELG